MEYTPVRQVKTARHIARSAQQKIKTRTGMQVSLLFGLPEDGYDTPEKMLEVVASALGMDPGCYKLKCRTRDIVELRFIAALFIRRHFPFVTLHQIAWFFGGLDHSSVISGLARANNLIFSGDQNFIKKYDTVLKSVDQWLRKEASAYASVASA